MATKKTTDVPAEAEMKDEIIETPVAEAPVTEDTKVTAKAGKRSAKAVAEVEAKVEKEERKAARAETEADEADKPKAPVTPTRSRLERRGKQFRKVAEQVEKGKLYTVEEAVALAKKTSTTKFDATVELHIRLGVDPRHADQNIRDNLVLPAGTGKTVKVAVLADVDDAAAAKKAGADVAGIDEILKDLDKGQITFDTLIATPSQMSKLGKYARVLGPRGLMPNPKSGTVTTDVAHAVKQAKAGRVEYRVDSTGIVHLGMGKVSFTEAQLVENAQAVFASIRNNKPNSLKGNYFKAVHLSTTMGPSIVIDLSATN
ncbi:MAG: ribosomal protein [Candidatus Saccharibacteria bacterium]|nr:ribosomal protein [Candidatus Saccharibacteria bacterium]